MAKTSLYYYVCVIIFHVTGSCDFQVAQKELPVGINSFRPLSVGSQNPPFNINQHEFEIEMYDYLCRRHSMFIDTICPAGFFDSEGVELHVDAGFCYKHMNPLDSISYIISNYNKCLFRTHVKLILATHLFRKSGSILNNNRRSGVQKF